MAIVLDDDAVCAGDSEAEDLESQNRPHEAASQERLGAGLQLVRLLLGWVSPSDH
jgi:hypothetical protein